jgi:hypothetical protein
VDVQAWGPTGETTRVVSDRTWQANGRPALLPEVKRDSFAWSPLAIEGPGARTSPPLAAAVSVTFDGGRGVEGMTNAVTLQVWAAAALPDARVRLRLQNWQGDEVFNQDAAIAWRGAEGRARVALPGLLRAASIARMPAWRASPTSAATRLMRCSRRARPTWRASSAR